MRELHWLTIKARTEYKIILLTYQSMLGLALYYLRSLRSSYAPKRMLRSSAKNLLQTQKEWHLTSALPSYLITIPYKLFLFAVRLLSRIIFVPFENIQRSITQEQSISDHLLSKVSAIVGKVLPMGQWLSSKEGKDAFNECLGIVVHGLGEEGKGTRFAKMQACGLMAVVKVVNSVCLCSIVRLASRKENKSLIFSQILQVRQNCKRSL